MLDFLFWFTQASCGLMFIGYAAIILRFKFVQKPVYGAKRWKEIRLVGLLFLGERDDLEDGVEDCGRRKGA